MFSARIKSDLRTWKSYWWSNICWNFLCLTISSLKISFEQHQYYHTLQCFGINSNFFVFFFLSLSHISRRTMLATFLMSQVFKKFRDWVGVGRFQGMLTATSNVKPPCDSTSWTNLAISQLLFRVIVFFLNFWCLSLLSYGIFATTLIWFFCMDVSILTLEHWIWRIRFQFRKECD